MEGAGFLLDRIHKLKWLAVDAVAWTEGQFIHIQINHLSILSLFYNYEDSYSEEVKTLHIDSAHKTLTYKTPQYMYVYMLMHYK